MVINHARIASEALRFRLGTFSTPVDGPPAVDPEEAGAILGACGDPGVDHALRMVGQTWQQAGLIPEPSEQPWAAGDAARMRSVGGTALLDALDDLVSGISSSRIMS